MRVYERFPAIGGRSAH
ncbi:hypothetical protein [Pyxidicoccus fallax]|nr:hypothetical protein [Pyxidicoccus fallax]